MTSTVPNAGRRALCPRCERPQSTCICQWIRHTANQVEVIILQHPLEVGHAKGTGKLLQNSLRYCTLVVGEDFDPAALRALLFDPHAHTKSRPVSPALLYPASDDRKATVTTTMQEDSSTGVPINRLVVLDGTWRKSRKMLYCNPLLQTLPRVALTDMPATRYTIRKAHRSDQLSTLEATCQALMQLEGTQEKYLPLLNAFDGFVHQQQAYVEAYSHQTRTSESSQETGLLS